MCDNKPLGADSDPNAPYNEVESDLPDNYCIECLIRYSIDDDGHYYCPKCNYSQNPGNYE